jgi:hypothetical protein
VITEPVNLAQHNPTSRPANTLVILKPAYATPPTIPFSQMAIADVMITPPVPFSGGDDSSTHTVCTIIHHQSMSKRCSMVEASIMNIHLSLASK